MTFEISTDLELVRLIMTLPRIYRHITDDFSPPPEEFRPAEHPSICYVLVFDGHEHLGLFVVTRHNGVTVEIHTCLLPCAWGARAKQAASEFAAWLWANAPQIQRIVTVVPDYNRLALRFARAAGMTEYGRNPASIQKGGKLHDEILLGLSRPEGETRCQQH